MIALQTMKRPRDGDSDSEGERYLKKSRAWAVPPRNASTNYASRGRHPLRASPTPSPPRVLPGLEAMTPAPSEPSEATTPASTPASVRDDPVQFSSPRDANTDEDMDMDMAEDEDEDDYGIVGSPPMSPPSFHPPMRPAKLDSSLFGRDSAINTARIPTPMYPSFAASRGSLDMSGMNGLGYPSSGSAAVPSPIDEDDHLPDTPTALTQSQLERLSVTSTAEHMDMDTGNGDSSVAPPGVVTPTTGRKRSGALSGKGKFIMGYRDDCEKCRQRVPGHYSHFLP